MWDYQKKCNLFLKSFWFKCEFIYGFHRKNILPSKANLQVGSNEFKLILNLDLYSRNSIMLNDKTNCEIRLERKSKIEFQS